MKYPIEDNIPLPPRRGGPGVPLKYPFDQLAIGQSFLIPDAKTFDADAIRTLGGNYGYRHNCKFSVRVVDGGVRVWRVA